MKRLQKFKNKNISVLMQP